MYSGAFNNYLPHTDNLDRQPNAIAPGSTDPRLVERGTLFLAPRVSRFTSYSADQKKGWPIPPTTPSMSMNSRLDPRPGSKSGFNGRIFRK
jgi:hypothetical protein